MNEPSPPVRVTRARAAAKADPKLNVATASSKAAKAPKANPTTTITKRKTRAHDAKDEEPDELTQTQESMKEIIEPEAPKTRGRQKKTAPNPPVEVEEAAPKTRGRAKKVLVDAAEPAQAPEPTRASRGRAKKVEKAETVEESNAIADKIVVAEPVKKPTRGRAAASTKPAAPKKTVKFEEPDKENVVPAAKGKPKAEVETGLRAKPVRKPTATTTTARATRGRAKVEEKVEKPSPLSPKKITQIAIAKDNSDDELATTEKTPMKPLMKSPVKPPGSIFGTGKKTNFENNISVHKASVPHQDLSASMMASPARRPPQSPFKDAMKASPQKLVFGDSLTRSPAKFSLPPPKSAVKPDLKASLLQSPARRPQSPMKVTEAGSPSKPGNHTVSETPKVNTFKISRFATPKTVTRTPGHNAPDHFSTLNAEPTTISEESPSASIPFSGRLSSIMPRDVDPDPISEPGQDIVQENEEGIVPETEVSEPMVVDDMAESIEEVDKTSTPPKSPRDDTGTFEVGEVSNYPAFCLREDNNSPFDDSDSEDELANPRYSQSPLSSFKVSAHDFASSPATPTPFTANDKTPKASFSTKRAARRSEIGFTPLAKQLSNWMAASPESDQSDHTSDVEHPSPLRSNPMLFAAPEAVVQASPAKSTFFEDEMSVRDELAADSGEAIILEEDPNFSPIELLEEDINLAAEADEMSMLEPQAPQSTNETVGEFFSNETDVLDVGEANLQENEPDQDGEVVADECHPVNIEAAEVDELSLPQPTEVDEPVEETFEEHLLHDAPVETEVAEEDLDKELPAPSEASQEYADENAIPVDPQLFARPETQPPALSTPKRVLSERVCHTVYKVPLKPAADDSPMRVKTKKRSASISKLPVTRPSSNLSRSNTVISYSPTKSTPRTQPRRAASDDVQMADVPITPSKGQTVDWSTVGTPARTPRRDLNFSLLKGAVVFVDVHTSEGADASVLFTELLTQMGARCVKSWNWNGEDGSKIGITHVVFKDGGKRTIERARETGGVVACVGVGWVLDCERENKWLDEASYAVDTSNVPRGGYRRRKSMEPRALANLNGTLMTPSAKTPSKNASPTKSLPQTPATTKSVNRRESVQWTRSPVSSDSNEEKIDNETMALSPIPATPAPEALSAYGEAYLDSLNAGAETPGGQTPYFLHKEKLVQMTAPPKQRIDENGSGFLSEKKDETVMMRLMAARRKSLQWAPKVGSPLAKGAEWAL